MNDDKSPKFPQLHAFRHEVKHVVAGIVLSTVYSGRKYTDFKGGDLKLEIKVPGYWGDGVRVVWDRVSAEVESQEPEVRYSSGGYERDYSNIQRAKNFAAAMHTAAEVAQRWVDDGWEEVFGDLFELSNEKVLPQ